MLLENANRSSRSSNFLDRIVVLFFSKELCHLSLGISARIQNWLELERKRTGERGDKRREVGV
jgi:hypothetical protein